MIQAKLKSWMYLGTTLLSGAVFSISVGEGVVIKIKREKIKMCLGLFFFSWRESPTMLAFRFHFVFVFVCLCVCMCMSMYRSEDKPMGIGSLLPPMNSGDQTEVVRRGMEGLLSTSHSQPVSAFSSEFREFLPLT